MNNTYSFVNQSVSIFGITGLRWPYFDPTEVVGQEITVTVDILSTPRLRFTTKGFVMAEETGTANYLGVTFSLDPMTAKKIRELVAKEGFYPTQHLRKFPRIPAREEIASMPMHAIVMHESGETVAFELSNLSPTGTLLRTENPRAGFFLPRQRVKVQIEPRGEAVLGCRMEGLICRSFFEKNQKTGNIIRSFGIRFVKMTEGDKQNFLEILRLVLNNLQELKK